MFSDALLAMAVLIEAPPQARRGRTDLAAPLLPLAFSAGTLPSGLTARNSGLRCCTLPRLMRTSSKGMPASLVRKQAGGKLGGVGGR